jgi:hypothetical protein
MSAEPAPTPPPQRTIGEILLAHGYVDQEQLDRALARQQETGFPLGQILVEAGSITRLELASALAVQWSDMPIAVRSNDDDSRQGLVASDGGERKARLAPAADPAWQEELSTTVRALGTRLEHVEAALVSLTAQDEGESAVDPELEALRARLDASEALLAEVARRSSESLTPDQLEERLCTVAAALETALSRADDLEAQLAPLATRIERQGHGAEAAIAELRASLAALHERPAGDPSLAARVAELSLRIDALPDSDRLEELNAVVAALEERPSADPVLATRVEELSRRLDGLAAPPEADPSLADAVAALGERVSRAAGAEVIEQLQRQVASLAEQPTTSLLEQRLSELAARVEQLAQRPAAEPGLAERLGALEAGLTAELSAGRARLDELERRQVDSGAETGTTAAEVERSLAVAAQASEALERRLAAATEIWATERAMLERRLDELAAQLQRSRALPQGDAVPPATGVPGTAPSEGSGADDLNRLWFAVERISLQLTEHHRDIDRLLAEGDPDGRLDELAGRLDDLEDRATVSAWPAAGPGGPTAGSNGDGPGARALARKLDELQKATRTEREKLLTQIDQIVGSLEWRLQRLESVRSAAPPLGS